MAFRISSAAFADGATIPVRHTCDGEDRSPRLTWFDAPEGAQSFVLIVDDPDAPAGTFTHWVLYDIPRGATELAENVSGGTVGRSGRNSLGQTGYGGPCPPPDSDAHRYRFTLHALDATLGLPEGMSRDEVEARMDGQVLASARLVGMYQRHKPAAGTQ